MNTDKVNRIQIHAEPSFIWMPFKHYVSAKIRYFEWLGIAYEVQEILDSIKRVKEGIFINELDVAISEDITFKL